MRALFAAPCLLLISCAGLPGATAFTALQLVPAENARRVAIIAGRDGTPQPERWHFLVHDPEAEKGVREIVIDGARRTANRTVSQFAEEIGEQDVIDREALKVDSDQVARLALQFGTANKVAVSGLHFDLRKSGPEAAPLWTVTCLDARGAELGRIIVSASRGTVIMHPGFAAGPPPEVISGIFGDLASAAPRPDAASRAAAGTPTTVAARKATPRRRPAATPAPKPTPKPGLFQRMFGGGGR
jgi:hypothetical protein